MKKKHLLNLICLGLLLSFAPSCSDDKDEELDTPDPTEKEEEKEPEEEKEDPNVTYKYYGAELYSKETFKYGRFEAKMKMAYAPGCISSMFLYYNNSYKGGGEVWNEIDIEIIGKDSLSFQSNIITGTLEKKTTTESIHKLGYPVNTDYHVYVMEWTPDYVLWTVDGVEVRRNTITNDTKKQVADLVMEQSLRFNLWSSKSIAWVGSLNPKKLPIYQTIDYVKVYDWNETTGEFTERWTDDFDTFNTTRWGRGNWAMEQVTESTKNVYVEDGALTLALTKVAVE